MKKKVAPGANPASGPGTDPAESPEGFAFMSAEDMEAAEEWARIRAEFGDDEGKVILKRRNAKGQLAMLDFMSVNDFSFDRVMQDWGGGRYIATAFKNQIKMGQVQFEIDESIPKRTPIKEVPPSQPQAAVAVHGAPQEDPRIAALERSIQSQNDLMKTLITAMVAKQGNGSESALEMGLKIAEMINQRTPTAEKPSFADLKDIFLAGIEAKQAAEGGGEEGYAPVLKAFAGPIAKVLDSAMGADRRRMMAGSMPVQPTAPAPQPAPAALPPGQAWMVHLQPHLNTLLGWAKAGKDPELYAEVILDNIEPGAQMEIGQAAQDPEFVSKTLAALPMFIPYSAWATAVLTNMKELLTAPPEEGGGDSTQE